LKLNFIQENSFSVSILSQLICRVLTHKWLFLHYTKQLGFFV
jgi:hypothetical protein